MEEFRQQALQLLSGVVVHVVVLWLLIAAASLGVVVLYCTGRVVRGALFTVAPLAMLIWFFVALSCPWKAARVDYYEITTVAWPDGTSCQMWSADGTHYNSTQQFAKTVDPERWRIERVTWEPVYLHVSFSGTATRLQRPTFNLVEKKP